MTNQSPAVRLTLLNLILLLAEVCTIPQAQQFTGIIGGTVQESEGAVVSGAGVPVVNIGTLARA